MITDGVSGITSLSTFSEELEQVGPAERVCAKGSSWETVKFKWSYGTRTSDFSIGGILSVRRPGRSRPFSTESAQRGRTQIVHLLVFKQMLIDRTLRRLR